MTARSALDSDPLPGEPLASIRVTGGIVRALRGHVQLAAILALLPIVLAEAAARRAVHGVARKGQATPEAVPAPAPVTGTRRRWRDPRPRLAARRIVRPRAVGPAPQVRPARRAGAMSDIRLAVAAVSIGVLVAMIYLGGMTVAPLSTILFGLAR